MDTVFDLRLCCLVLGEDSASPENSVYSLRAKSDWSLDDLRRALTNTSPCLEGQVLGYIKVYKLDTYLDAPTSLAPLEPDPSNATSYNGTTVTRLKGVEYLCDHFQEPINHQDARKIHLVVALHSLYVFL